MTSSTLCIPQSKSRLYYYVTIANMFDKQAIQSQLQTNALNRRTWSLSHTLKADEVWL